MWRTLNWFPNGTDVIKQRAGEAEQHEEHEDGQPDHGQARRRTGTGWTPLNDDDITRTMRTTPCRRGGQPQDAFS